MDELMSEEGGVEGQKCEEGKRDAINTRRQADRRSRTLDTVLNAPKSIDEG